MDVVFNPDTLSSSFPSRDYIDRQYIIVHEVLNSDEVHVGFKAFQLDPIEDSCKNVIV